MPQDDHEIMNHAVVQTEFERACNSTLLASVGNRRAPLTAQVTVKSRQTSHVACLYAPSIRAMQKASRVAPFGSTSTSCEAPFLGLGAHEGFRAGEASELVTPPVSVPPTSCHVGLKRNPWNRPVLRQCSRTLSRAANGRECLVILRRGTSGDQEHQLLFNQACRLVLTLSALNQQLTRDRDESSQLPLKRDIQYTYPLRQFLKNPQPSGPARKG